jgi:acetyl esterase/lipase
MLLVSPCSLAAQAAPVAEVQTAPPSGFTQALRLWPGNAPDARGATSADIPKLFSYPAAGLGLHPAVIVLPGGGYSHLVMEKEGADAARFLAARGVNAYVLQYRLGPTYRFPIPMVDASRAVRYLRANAQSLGLDPHKIGLWGFSAGGHLAGYLATNPAQSAAAVTDPIDRFSDRPDFVIISYGRLTLDDSIPRPTTFEPILGDHATKAARDAVDDTLRVTAHTPPTFLYSTTADQTVNSRTATAFYNALKRNGVPAELHIFERGPHGTGIALNPPPGQEELAIYPMLVAAWLRQHGWMPPAP